MARATPTFEAAGIVVTEIRTPTDAPLRASVSETAPATPASTAMITANKSGLLMKLVRGRSPRWYVRGDAASPAQHHCQAGGCNDGSRETDCQGDETASHSA